MYDKNFQNITKPLRQSSHSKGTLKNKVDLAKKKEFVLISKFGIMSQSLIGGYDPSHLSKITLHKNFTDVGEFKHSKPSAKDGYIKIYSYRSRLQNKFSKYKCVWYKLKTPDAIDKNFSIPKTGKNLDPEKILQLAFHEAKKIVPEAATLVKEKGIKISFQSRNMVTGFKWIPSDVKMNYENKHLTITTPTLITHPNIPKLGGMCYCKVFTPMDAAHILIDLANNKFNF